MLRYLFCHKRKNRKELTMTTKKENQSKNTPDFNVHAVVPKGVESRIGSQIGCVFNHNNGGGFTILLDANPIPNLDGQIKLVAYPVNNKS